MNPRKILVLFAAVVATLILASPAQAAPTAKDARTAGAKAKRAVTSSLAAARAGRSDDAIAGIARARHLQARAARIARRAGARKGPATRAKLLRGAASGVDDAFDSYAEVLAQMPPKLQPYVVGALEQLQGLRTELVAELTGFIDTLPPDVREQVLAAIASFQADGDFDALLAALTDPNVTVAVQAQLEQLIAQLTTTLQEQITSFEGLEELLPPAAAEQLQAAMAQIQSQLETVLANLASILSPEGPGAPPELPELSGDLCAQLEAFLQALGLPVPPGFCPAA